MSPLPGSDRIRAARTKLEAGNALFAAVRKDPRIARDLITGLIGAARSHSAPAATPAEEADGYLTPAGVSDYARSAHARRGIRVAPDAVAAYLSDLNRLADWFTLHAGWRGEAPGAVREGLTFTQQALVMGIPAELRWTVVEAGERGFALRGEGPQGVRLGYWLTVAGAGDEATVYFDAGLGGPPVEGPLGASVARSLGEAMEQSLARLPDAIAAAGPVKSVRHSPFDIAPRAPRSIPGPPCWWASGRSPSAHRIPVTEIRPRSR